MELTRRHPHGLRLWTLTAALFVLAAAFANSAQAGLGLLGGTNDPLAPVTSATSELTSTVDTTVSTVTSSGEGLVETTQATVTEAQRGLEETTSGALTSTEETANGLVNATTASAEQTANGTLALVGETLPPIEELRSELEPRSGAPAPRVTPSTLPPGTAGPATVEPAAPMPIPATTPTPAAQETVSAAAVEGGPLLLSHAPSTGRTSAPLSASREAPRSAPTGAGAAFRSAAGSSPHAADHTAPARDLPETPSPLDPSSSFGALLEAGTVGSGLVLASLLALIALSAQALVSGRLRLVADELRSSDVLFRLERPG